MKNIDDGQKYDFVELFLVAADVHRTFVASMVTKTNDVGEEFVTASVRIVEGEVISAAPNRTELENQLDEICRLKLDHYIHEIKHRSKMFFQYKLFFN